LISRPGSPVEFAVGRSGIRKCNLPVIEKRIVQSGVAAYRKPFL
jgi:hypothetical protein